MYQGCTNSTYWGHPDDYILYCGALYLCVPIVELSSCEPSGTQNFELAPRFLGNVCTPDTYYKAKFKCRNTVQKYVHIISYVNLLANRILRWLLDFWKMCVPLINTIKQNAKAETL
jgi:hypothetical protein